MDRPVLIFQGVAWEAESLKSKLKEAGIEVIATYLPHIEGHELHVSASRAEEAQGIVRAEGRRVTKALSDASDDGDPELEPLRLLGKKIAPLTMFVWTAPAGVFIGAVYFARVRRLQRKPPQHMDFLLAWAASAVVSLIIFVVVFAWLRA